MTRWFSPILGLVLMALLVACPKGDQGDNSTATATANHQSSSLGEEQNGTEGETASTQLPSASTPASQQASNKKLSPGQQIMGMETGGDIILNEQWRHRMLGKGLATDHYWELQIVAAQVKSFLAGEGRFPESYEEVKAMGYAIIDPGVKGLTLTKQALRMVVSGQVRTETDAPLSTMQIVVQPEGMLPSEMMGGGGMQGAVDLSIPNELVKMGISTRDQARRAVKASRIIRDLSHLAFFFVVEKGRVPQSSQELLDYGKGWIVQSNLVDPWTQAPVTFTDQGGNHIEFISRPAPSPDQIGSLTLRYLALPKELAGARGNKFFRESLLSSDWLHFWH